MTHEFIEVTLSDLVNEPNERTRKRLINTKWIEQVVPFDNYTMIYFAFEENDDIDLDFVKCKESYEEIKNMLW